MYDIKIINVKLFRICEVTNNDYINFQIILATSIEQFNWPTYCQRFCNVRLGLDNVKTKGV